MLKFTQLVLRSSKNVVAFQNLTRLSTFPSASTATAQTVAIENEIGTKTTTEQVNLSEKSKTNQFTVKSSNAMITAAFAALRSEDDTGEIKTPQTDARLANAQTVNDLLSISDGVGVSRKHALKVMSVLADWCASGKAKLADFESDSRFIRLCRVLTKGAYLKNQKIAAKSEDLSTVMNVAADDEAAKLVGSISLGQMVKVFTTLAQQKRRSASLLRALAYNLSGVPQSLDIKQCGDVLYSSAVLNFYDQNLFEKVCADVCRGLTVDLVQHRSAALGSIVTSLGLLRYKENTTMDNISAWFLNHYDICRQQDVFSLFQTCAVLNYQSTTLTDLYQKLKPHLRQSETTHPFEWLDIVWSLVLLNLADEQQISSVLSNEFVKTVVDVKSSSVATKLKLLNVNAFAEWILKGYNGPKLDTFQDLQLARSKEKEQMVSVAVDTLKNLMAEWCLQSNINTKMGFLLDAECYLDKKCNPVALKKLGDYSEKLIKVGVLVQDYHDFCRGKVEPTGVNALAFRLLEAQGYSVLIVPYTEFRVNDKLVRRVQYIESKLREIVKASN